MRSIKHSEAARINAAKAWAITKQRAIDRYNKSPNICKFCNKIMELKEGQKPFEVRQKIYCSHSCSAKATNCRRRKLENRRPCPFCGKEIRNKETKHCISCRAIFLYEKTGDLSKGQVSRERISTHARWIIKERLSSCLVCGYDFAVEAAHIKPVKSFSMETTVREINLIENLIPLCPNHHLEFDRGKITLEDIRNVGLSSNG